MWTPWATARPTPSISPDSKPAAKTPRGNRITYSYDLAGRQIALRNALNLATTTSYDAASRLTADHTTGTNAHSYTYTYDAVDNRLTETEAGTTRTWTYSLAGRITTMLQGANVSTYTYDTDGSLTEVRESGSIVTMSYDKERRLVKHNDGATVATYTYSGDGLKRSEILATGRTTLVWDGTDYLQGRS